MVRLEEETGGFHGACVRPVARVIGWVVVFCIVVAVQPGQAAPKGDLWVLRPVARPAVPEGSAEAGNPIDAFVAAEYRARGLTPVGRADKSVLLRRVYLDLTGLPPTPAEQAAFLQDASSDAYEKVVDRLLASEQHGVRYGRHWLDVLRYADADERMVAGAGIYLWRDWVIRALNDDLPYDQFVRAQLTGQRAAVRTQMSATGVRSRIEPRADDMFALGFLARGDVIRDGKRAGEMAITAVETVSTAFMGLTVGCAKCHDHMYDPIKCRDFYSMKALFDPLVLRKVVLGSPAEILAAGRAQDEIDRSRAAIARPLEELVAPYKKKLYDQRVLMLPDDVQVVIRKPEKERSAAEQKIADDYFPVLRIDADKFLPLMPEGERKKYQDLKRRLGQITGRAGLPAFWTVEVDAKKEQEKNYLLTSGDPERPELDHEVQPGWPFAPAKIDFREGRREAFSDWLTAADNPMLARVAVNRLWQWHFGEGLQKTPSDFGALGGMPSNPKLLDWLASEFAARGFSMKQMHRLMVTSETYKLASAVDGSASTDNSRIDPTDTYLWHFRLQRLEAEPIWDSIFTAAGSLDLAVGGASFDPAANHAPGIRRAAYMARGYSSAADVTPQFLQAFDVDDGRAPCPVRTQTVTAPQALFAMNGSEVEQASVKLAERLRRQCGGDLPAAVDMGYRMTLGRSPSPMEVKKAADYLGGDPDRLKGFAWLMFNLDEFVYVR
jgi:hypothetical protein